MRLAHSIRKGHASGALRWAQDPLTKLVNIEIPPDDEVSRVSRADLFLEDIG